MVVRVGEIWFFKEYLGVVKKREVMEWMLGRVVSRCLIFVFIFRVSDGGFRGS